LSAIFGPNLRQRQQLAGSADSAGVEMVKRPQFLGQQPLLGIQPAARMAARIRASISPAE
jgi:hypothetical protein